jgi:acyl-coenzyme A thioesterase PaaI-like protein
MKAFQDYYPENVSHCYGCGSNNHHGHQIKTFWEGEETVTRFKPEPFHTSVPGYAYGGLIASLIDCHSTGTAAAAMYRSEGREMGTLPPFRFVTGSLHVDFLKPTPLDATLEIRGRVKEIKGRKVVVETTASSTVWPSRILEFKFSGNRDLKVVLYCKTSGRAAMCGKSA